MYVVKVYFRSAGQETP